MFLKNGFGRGEGVLEGGGGVARKVRVGEGGGGRVDGGGRGRGVAILRSCMLQ